MGFLSGMVAMIMMRTLHRDFNRYNAADATEELEEDTGWKLVHGDVFRPPQNPMLLFVFMGVPAGYASAFLHKTLKGTEWKQNIILTSCLFPGIVFLIFFILNFFVWGEKSS